MTKAQRHREKYLPSWKDADPDIPILKDAKSEYEKLKQLP